MTYTLQIESRDLRNILDEIRAIPASKRVVDITTKPTIDGDIAYVNNSISAEDLAKILASLPEHISSVIMGANGLNRFNREELSLVLQSIPNSILDLSLKQNNLNTLDSLNRDIALNKLHKNLSLLDLWGNSLYELSYAELGTLFMALPPNIQTLRLGGNGFGTFSVETLTKIIQSLPRKLKSLDLGFNDLGNFSTDELMKIMGDLPNTLISLDLSNNGLEELSKNDLIKILKGVSPYVTNIRFNNGEVDPMLFIIDTEISRLESYNSSNAGFMATWGIMEISDDKIAALNSLKEILIDRTNKDPEILKQELIDWRQRNGECIKVQRNKIHAFFSPNHKSNTHTMVDELLSRLSTVDTNTLSF